MQEAETMPNVSPEIMIWARETAGLTLEEAAKKLGFQDSTKSSAADKLSAIEEGEQVPTRPQLLKMSDQYRRPLLTFYLSKPPKRGERGADFRTLTQNSAPSTEALLDALIRDVRKKKMRRIHFPSLALISERMAPMRFWRRWSI